MSESPADALKRVEARIALAESYVTTLRGSMRNGSQLNYYGSRQQYEAWLTHLLDAKAEWHKLKREETGRKFLESLGVNPAGGSLFGNYLKGQREGLLAQYYNSALPA